MFSIVTANYNGDKFLKLFLDSLVNQSFQGFNLYIVDNGSKDNSKSIIKAYENKLNITLIELEKNFGFAEANNIGIDAALKDKNQHIVTLNNDLELDKDCLKILADRIKDKANECEIFQMLMINYYERNIIDAAGIFFNEHYLAGQIGFKEDISKVKDLKTEIPGACAGAAVYSKKALTSVREENGDFFDSRFFAYYEDVDLALRLANGGFKTSLVKEAFVYHIHSGTGNEGSSFKAYYLSRNLYFYLKKNLSAKEYKQNRFYYMMHFVKKLIICVQQGKPSMIKPTFKGYFDYKNKIKPLLTTKK